MLDVVAVGRLEQGGQDAQSKPPVMCS